MSWPKVKIGDLVESISKWNPKENPAAPSFTYIDLSSIDKERKLIHEVTIVHPSEAPSRARQLVQENDVLVSTVRPNLNGVAMVGSEYDGATASTGYCVLRSIPEKILPSFLFHWVKTPHFISEMTRNSTGANYPAVSDKTVKEHLISLPPIHEQRRISTILDKADEIKRLSKESHEMRDQLIRSVFLDMFGDPFGENQWTRIPFLDGVSDVTRGQHKILQSDYLDEGLVPIIDQGAELIGGWSNETEKVCSIPLPNIVFGDHTTELKYLEQPYILGADGVKVLTPSEGSFHPLFLFHLLRFFPFPDVGYSRHFKFLKEFMLIHPPEDLQFRFAEHCKSIDSSPALDSALVSEMENSIVQEMLKC